MFIVTEYAALMAKQLVKHVLCGHFESGRFTQVLL